MTDTNYDPQVEEQAPGAAPPGEESAPPFTPEPAPEPAYLEVDGQRYDAEALSPYIRTMQWATSHPDQWAQIQAWERRGYVADQPAQPEPEPEADDEYADPRVRALEARLAAFEQQAEERQALEDRTTIDTGWDTFLADHEDLSDEDRRQVINAARDWQVVAAAVEREQNPARRAQAVRDAFEYVYRATFFERAGQQAASQAVNNISRARRAGAPSSNRQTPRTRPEPKVETARDLENALRESLAEAMEANR